MSIGSDAFTIGPFVGPQREDSIQQVNTEAGSRIASVVSGKASGEDCMKGAGVGSDACEDGRRGAGCGGA